MAKKEKEKVEEIKDKEAKAQALKLALQRLEKSFGKGTVMRLGDKVAEKVEVIPSGSLGLDIDKGVWRNTRGRVIEIFGQESSGKTTLTLHAIAEAQKLGGSAAFIDAEHAFDPSYAKKIGIDVDNLIISQPDNGEQALEIVDGLVRSGAVDIIVVDSVAALTPKTEIDGEMGDSKMGVHARLMSQALRKITGSISKANCVVMFINQLRDKIGVSFGNPETTTGGNALKFYSSVRVDVRRQAAPLKNKEGEAYGSLTKVKVVKNKVAPPFQRTEFEIIYGEGISKVSEIVDWGTDFDILSKSGAWYSYGGTRLANGRDAMKALLHDNPEMAEEIEGKIKEAVKEGKVVVKKKGKKAATKDKAAEPDEDEEYDEPEEDDDFPEEEEDD